MNVQAMGAADIDLVKSAGNEAANRSTNENQQLTPVSSAAEVTISEEGLEALHKSLRDIGSDYRVAWEMENGLTDEVAREHYFAMREVGGEKIKNGGYDINDINDVASSIMESYEHLYNQIVEGHENGTRPVNITLEEDLEQLDKAFERRMGDLEGHIVCQQTNKAVYSRAYNSMVKIKRMQGSAVKKSEELYHYFDEEYRNDAISFMRQARNDFLRLFNSEGYQKGASAEIVKQLFSSNSDFMEKSRKLFS